MLKNLGWWRLPRGRVKESPACSFQGDRGRAPEVPKEQPGRNACSMPRRMNRGQLYMVIEMVSVASV